jgi:multicomponent Na+:H+ antiporter subunit C
VIALLCAVIAALFGGGVFLLLRQDLIKIVIGLGLIGNAVNLAIFIVGGWHVGTVPIMKPDQTTLDAGAIDPVPQALILTAIVIGFAMQAFLLVLARLQADKATSFDSQLIEDGSQ